MRIRVLGGGWYGSHLTLALLARGHTVELHEIADRLFAGASGGNPARCHLGFHYPRSGLTQAACQEHHKLFMERYGDLTAGVAVNIYAVARDDSLVDFRNYCDGLRGKVEFITIPKPEEFGLQNVEGAVLTGERHIVIRKARAYFEEQLAGVVRYGMPAGIVDDPRWDWTVDASFCANDSKNIDRFEPCLTVLLKGPADRATTIMDGPHGSIFPWDEEHSLSSMTSASLTPLSKTCRTWREARTMLDMATHPELMERAEAMLVQMSKFWPAVRDLYRISDYRLSIRAMPKSAADARLVDVVRIGDRTLRVRAGKIDAVFHAERIVSDMIRDGRRAMKQAMVA